MTPKEREEARKYIALARTPQTLVGAEYLSRALDALEQAERERAKLVEVVRRLYEALDIYAPNEPVLDDAEALLREVERG